MIPSRLKEPHGLSSWLSNHLHINTPDKLSRAIHPKEEPVRFEESLSLPHLSL